MKKSIAIIPARGGSKRLPGKNIKPFHGKPIIQYSIEAALSSGLFTKVIVTTDSDEIAKVARAAGAEVPFVRPENLADDFTPLAGVVHHALEYFVNAGENFDYACCLLATAPFIQAKYLKEGFEKIRETNASSVFPVTSFEFPIFRALKIGDEGTLSMFWPEHEMTRSNDLPHAYHDAGQFYWLDAKKFLRDKRIYCPDSRPVVLPRHLVQDVDTPEDWVVAEHLYEAMLSRK